MRAFLLVWLVNSATSNTDVSPVQKVVQLLDELKGKVAADLSNEEKMMEEYTMWCDSEANAKEDSITSTTRTIGDLQATIEDETASISSLTTEIEELAAKISTNDADLIKAKEIRKTDNTDLLSAEKELVETIDTLDRAIIVLKRGQTGFLQKGGKSKDMQALVAGLSAIVKASWVDSRQRSVVQSLLQGEDADDDEDLTLQPQATVAAYKSQGGSILEVLADMKDKAKAALSEARKNEMTSNHEFQLLEQGLTDEMSELNKRKSEATSLRSNSEEQLHTAEGDLSVAQDSLASDKAVLKDVKYGCASKSAAWEQRQKDAAEEMTAIEKAKEVLESGVKAFVQMGLVRVARDADESLKRDEVSQLLTKLSKKMHSFALSQVASAARQDPFGKVRGLIETMLERLTKEAAEEAEGKAFCDKEIAESKEKQADLTAKADRYTVRIEKAEAAKAKLAQDITVLASEIAEITKGQADATALRQKEKAEYKKASADYKQSGDAVASAISILQTYYEGASFMQLGTHSGQPEFGSAKTDVASGEAEKEAPACEA